MFINNAKVTVVDLEAVNGVVHVIDAVLLPTTTNISRLDEITFDIYPNPATDYIRINSNMGVENLIIRDIAGRVVTQKNNLSSSERIELNRFKSGMYLVFEKRKFSFHQETDCKIRLCSFFCLRGDKGFVLWKSTLI